MSAHQFLDVRSGDLGGRLPRLELQLVCAARRLIGLRAGPPLESGMTWSTVVAPGLPQSQQIPPLA